MIAGSWDLTTVEPLLATLNCHVECSQARHRLSIVYTYWLDSLQTVRRYSTHAAAVRLSCQPQQQQQQRARSTIMMSRAVRPHRRDSWSVMASFNSQHSCRCLHCCHASPDGSHYFLTPRRADFLADRYLDSCDLLSFRNKLWLLCSSAPQKALLCTILRMSVRPSFLSNSTGQTDL